MENLKTSEKIGVIVVMKEQLDFENLNSDFRKSNTSVNKRAKIVLNELTLQAQKTRQTIISNLINSENRKSGKIIFLKQWYIFNGFLVEADAQGIDQLLANYDIEYLDYAGRKAELLPYIDEENKNLVKSPTEPEAGLVVINAPPMWALGYTGRGRLIYGYDTGVWPDHPSFSERYMGRFFPPEQSWYGYWNPEPTGILNDHGTHTLGTAIGLDSETADTIGVAWGSYWIATDIIKGTIDQVPEVPHLVDAFEWALNPDGNFETVSDIPDVINNSWRWRDEIDTVECEGFVVSLFSALEAVGIANIFSGGNSGPSNTGINSPQRVKINEVNSFCVGAIDGNSATLPIVYFSTRGPSQCLPTDSALSIHPEVVAPGYYVRSAWGSNEYNSISGTSMSCPHVSGATLLLKEAFPYLPGSELLRALYYTAIDMGDPGEDNVYGRGLIDVYAAFLYLSETYTPVTPNYKYDLAIKKVFNPEILQICENPIAPELVFANLGDSTINEFKLYFSVNNGENDSLQFTGNIAAGEEISLILPEISFTPGQNILQLLAVIPETMEEVDYFNNRRYVELFVNQPTSLTFSENFENGIDTTIWKINNPDEGLTWDTLATTGLDSGMYSMYIDFGYGMELYEIDEISSPAIYLNEVSITDTLILSFDLAYQKRSNTFQDSLKIYASTDCGNTFPHLLYAANGTELSTWDEITPDFVPSLPEHWRRDSIAITGLETGEMFRFKFHGWNKRGNQLYIDNIRFEKPINSNILQINDLNKITAFPNPCNNEFTITNAENSFYEIINLTGKVILNGKIDSNRQTIQTKKLLPGYYFIRIIKDGNVSLIKLVVGK
ncbi:MAG: S8 family peptidase [Bacteroidales bacterium]|nr:S8 family peptidase [Bacteroidales bacterium]